MYPKGTKRKKGKNQGNMGGSFPQITQKEAEVLNLLTNEYATTREVSSRLKIQRKTVYNITYNLRRKGYLSKSSFKGGDTTQPFINDGVRLHNVKYRIRILFKDERYKAKIAQSNHQEINNNSVMFYPRSIVIDSREQFLGSTVDEAIHKALSYFLRLFIRIENDYNITLVKSRRQNIKFTYAHFALIKNGIAKDYIERGDVLRIYAKEDGKLAILVDNSFNLNELEFVHPETAKEDTETVKAWLEDLRECKINQSDLMKLIHTTIELNQINTMQIQSLLGIFKQILPNNQEIAQEESKEKPYYVG